MTRRRAKSSRALARLRRDAPAGPPFLCLLLDVPTVECLRLGVVNARAEVAARRALDALHDNARAEVAARRALEGLRGPTTTKGKR